MKIQKLEAIRGCAAVYVVIHHFIGFSFLKATLPPLVRLPFRFGQEAVILFFILSGFVIYLSVYKKKELNFKEYFLKRFVRIYPILIVSFGLSILFSYFNNHIFTASDLNQLFGNIFMLQDIDNKPGIHVLPFFKNDPLWSLSYEWWFYMMFYPLFFLRKKSSFNFIYIILGISVISWLGYLYFPDHLLLVLSYFVIWWAGLECADIFIRDKNFSFKNMLPVLSSLFLMLIFSMIPILQQYLAGSREFSQIKYPIIPFRHFFFSLLVLLIGLVWWKFRLAYFDRLFGYFAKLSSISYAVYIIHFPFVWLNMPYIGNRYLEIVVKLILIFVLSYVLEIKIQPFINSVFFKKNNKTETSLTFKELTKS